MRVENNGKSVRYFSFAEMVQNKPAEKQKTDKSKQIAKFLGVCKVCKQPLTYINGTNVFVCENPSCKGIKHTYKNKDGEEKVSYNTYTKIIEDLNYDYVSSLFEEE